MPNGGSIILSTSECNVLRAVAAEWKNVAEIMTECEFARKLSTIILIGKLMNLGLLDLPDATDPTNLRYGLSCAGMCWLGCAREYTGSDGHDPEEGEDWIGEPH